MAKWRDPTGFMKNEMPSTEMRDKKMEAERALKALNFIVPILEKFKFRWVITGGFAAYVYGVDRPLTDIDVDVDTSAKDPAFQKFLEQVKPYTTQPLKHFVDGHYDNYNMELTVQGIVLDICPMAEMNVVDKQTGKAEWFYKDGFPETERVDFKGVELPLLSKALLIKNKEQLLRDEFDQRDIDGLQKLVNGPM